MRFCFSFLHLPPFFILYYCCYWVGAIVFLLYWLALFWPLYSRCSKYSVLQKAIWDGRARKGQTNNSAIVFVWLINPTSTTNQFHIYAHFLKYALGADRHAVCMLCRRFRETDVILQYKFMFCKIQHHFLTLHAHSQIETKQKRLFVQFFVDLFLFSFFLFIFGTFFRIYQSPAVLFWEMLQFFTRNKKSTEYVTKSIITQQREKL